MPLDLSSFEKSIKHLEESLISYNESENLDEKIKRTLKRGTIQAFETSYEIAKKMFSRYLKEYHDQDIDHPNNLFRESAKVGLISDAEKWIDYRKYRNKTSHIYNLQIAEEVFSKADDFLQEVRYSLKQMKQMMK